MLNNVIDALPDSLEVLALRFGRLFIDKESTVSRQSNIKELKLYDLSVDEDVSNYLSQPLPRLESVAVSSWITDGDSNTLKLPNHRLKCVDISCEVYLNSRHASILNEHLLNDQARYLSLFRTKDEETLTYSVSMYDWYAEIKPLIMNSIDVHDHSLQHVLRPSTNFHTNNESHKNIYFECASVQTLYFNGYLIL